MERLKIEYVGIDTIKPYKNNAKEHPREQIEQIKKSIEDFGMDDPIGVWNNEIVEGHGRLIACKELGMTEVPIIRLDHLTDEERRAYTLAHNKLTMNSDFDLDILNEELMNFDTIDMSEFGFDLEFDVKEQEVVEDDVPEAPEEPKAKLGDIYQLGNHRLMCGDSTSEEDVAKLMNGVKADMVFTDPPYGMNAVSKSGVLSEKYKTDIMNDDDNTVAIDSFNLCNNYFKETKQVWWGANYYTECLPSAECWIVWDKNNGGSDQTDCELAWTNFRSVVRQFTMASEKINRVHPTQKPLNLISQIFKKFDKNNEYTNIVDLFGGSGSTLIACEQLNRKCFMMELDTHYISVIIERYINFTGNDVYRLNPDGTKTNWRDIKCEKEK